MVIGFAQGFAQVWLMDLLRYGDWISHGFAQVWSLDLLKDLVRYGDWISSGIGSGMVIGFAQGLSHVIG